MNKLEVSKVPEFVEMKVINGPAGATYVQKYIRLDLHEDLSRKFDKVVSQRNLLARRPDMLDGLDSVEIIKMLDGELEMKSE